MDRFYLSPEAWGGDLLELTGEEGHHAVRVMRKAVGERVSVFDGRGRWCEGIVREVAKASLTVQIEREESQKESSAPISLAVAMTKGKTMDLIIQKAVELGVARIQPLATTHTVVKLSEKERTEKSAKWQRVALEACKQCGQNHLPQVDPVVDLDSYLAEPRDGHCLIASLASGTLGLRERLTRVGAREPVSLLVGPEGDFTPGETAAALAAGFQPVTLGSIVLRVETACLYLISAVRYQLDQ